MAQYFEVLSQENNTTTEENRQFFANVDEAGQTIHYVLASDNQQQFGTQQILLSGDQLMLVNNSPQQIVIDQSQIYQQTAAVSASETGETRYIISEGSALEFVNAQQQQQQQQQQLSQQPPPQQQQQQQQELQLHPQQSPQQPVIPPAQSQQIYYMETPSNNVASGANMVSNMEQQQPQNQQIDHQSQTAPIVLNNQIGGKVVTKVMMPQQVRPQIRMQNSPRMAVNSLQQMQGKVVRPQQLNLMRPQLGQKGFVNRPNTPLQQPYRRLPTPQMQMQQKMPNQIEDNKPEEMVTLPDGSQVTQSVYKKLQQSRPAQTHSVLNARPRGNNTRPVRPVRMPGKVNQLSGRAPNPPIVRNRLPNYSPYNPQQQQQQQQIQQGSPMIRNGNPQQRFPLNQQQLMQVQRQQQQMQQQQQQRSQANYIIQPPHAVAYQQRQQRPFPSHLYSERIQQIIDSTPVNDGYNDSIRMLVLLPTGEQRLITFTLPKEACTIREILEQVSVPFDADTPIDVTETNTNGINYVVAVGDINLGNNTEVENNENSTPPNSQPVPEPQNSQPLPPSQPNCETNADTGELESPPTPEPVKEKPKYIPGKLAVCQYCGYLSEDFNRCSRCKRKVPPNPKEVVESENELDTKPTSQDNKSIVGAGITKKIPVKLKTDPAAIASKIAAAKKKLKSKVTEELVVVSSDEESEDKNSCKKMNDQLMQKIGSAVTISPVSKEPTLADMRKFMNNALTNMPDNGEVISKILDCRTVRIGSYRYEPSEKILIDTRGFSLRIPHLLTSEIIPLRIKQVDIVKVLVSFNKSLPVLFFYLNPSIAPIIRDHIGMNKSPYDYDPLSEDMESHRRITLLPKNLTEKDKADLQAIYAKVPNVFEEINASEANLILLKSYPKTVKESVGHTSIKQLLVYPPEGAGRISINTGDYECLGTDQFLNDVIIDFYLKYITDLLPEKQRQKVHVFSTFFYKRLTTKPTKTSRKCQPTELDPNLTAAEKRHARIQKWTKNVNIFEKDYIVVPINENAHWFLAIICFPGMEGVHTMNGQPYRLEQKKTKKKKVKKNEADTDANKNEHLMCEDPELSDKDEAEGDDSELESEEEFEEQPPVAPEPKTKASRPPIKQPCILIFDSLSGGTSRSRVVATLRDYLTCEYKVKMNKEKHFNKDNIKGACPKIPQQNNFTDCGLYLLQYVEHFFKDPIKDFYIPINHLKNWFEEIIVTKKREDIANLIKKLMREYGEDLSLIPNIPLPTENGKLVDVEDKRTPSEIEEDMFEDIGGPPAKSSADDEDLDMDEDESEQQQTENSSQNSDSDSAAKCENSPIKPSQGADNQSDFVEQKIPSASLLKPDLSEFPRQTTNRDTLSYLKAKRIVRHKNTDGPESKKIKSDQT